MSGTVHPSPRRLAVRAIAIADVAIAHGFPPNIFARELGNAVVANADATAEERGAPLDAPATETIVELLLEARRQWFGAWFLGVDPEKLVAAVVAAYLEGRPL